MFHVGDSIYHAAYGYGTIYRTYDAELMGERGYEVAFDRYPGKLVTIIGDGDMMRENEYRMEQKRSAEKKETPVMNMSKQKEEPENVKAHKKIVLGLNELYKKKNADYGDSFHQSYIEEGMAMPRIRLSDKLNRFKALTKNGRQEVKDESIRDTLLDLANYAIMTVLELDREEEGQH